MHDELDRPTAPPGPADADADAFADACREDEWAARLGQIERLLDSREDTA